MGTRITWSNELEKERPRFGRLWTEFEYQNLRDCWESGQQLEQIAYQMGRPVLGVLMNLEKLGFIRGVDKGSNFWIYEEMKPADNSSLIGKTVRIQLDNTIANKEQLMSTKNIEKQVLIRGRNAADMSDEDIFNFIANLETKLEAMGKIKAPSTKLEAARNALQEDINELVKYVDGR